MIYTVKFYQKIEQRQKLHELTLQELTGAELLDYSVSAPQIRTAAKLDTRDVIYIDTYNLYYMILDQIEQPDGVHIQLQAIARRPD